MFWGLLSLRGTHDKPRPGPGPVLGPPPLCVTDRFSCWWPPRWTEGRSRPGPFLSGCRGCGPSSVRPRAAPSPAGDETGHYGPRGPGTTPDPEYMSEWVNIRSPLLTRWKLLQSRFSRTEDRTWFRRASLERRDKHLISPEKKTLIICWQNYKIRPKLILIINSWYWTVSSSLTFMCL